MFISLVSTLYRSEAFVEEFARRAATALGAVTNEYEIVLVDDGSPDRSCEIARRLVGEIKQLRVIELSRNFGHHPAILAGLGAARGELIFLVDSDLEEPPELLGQLLGALGDNDVIYGRQRNREGHSALRRLTSAAFWQLISRVSKVPIPPFMLNVRLMRRRYVDALLAMPDRNIFLGGMFAWPGFRQTAIDIERQPRTDTSYSWRARFRLAAQAAIAFSDGPLYLVFGIGLLVTLISFLIGVVVLVNKLVNPDVVVDGFTSIILSIWFLGGVLLFCVGVLGFYIAHIYNQTRARPRYFIRAEYSDGDPN